MADQSPTEERFIIDNAPQTSSSSSHIAYEQPTHFLGFGSDEPQAKDDTVVRNSCFNCGRSGHILSKCPEPKDFRRIGNNRRRFMGNRAPGMPLHSRYYTDELSLFSNVSPGLPSAKLRRALGIEWDQLPCYIYRMRQMGYPPGWLKEAEINHSGLKMFLNKDRSLGDISDEEGEIVESEDKKRYDLAKLHQWPGFNVKPSDTFRDESDKFGGVPMQNKHSLESMIADLAPKAQKSYIKMDMQDTSSGYTSEPKTDTEPQSPEKDQAQETTRQSAESPPANSGVLTVKAMHDGTPICAQYSNYSQVPPRTHWTTNVGMDILFGHLVECESDTFNQIARILKRERDFGGK